MRHALVVLLATVAVAPLGAQTVQSTPDSLTLGRTFTKWFYAAQWDSLLAHQPAQIRSDTTLRPQLEQRLEALRMRGSQETAVLEEKFVTRNGIPQYWRVASFSNFPEPLLIRWMINPSGEIVGMALSALSQAPPIDSTGAGADSTGGPQD